jgi:hypothetical protein
LNALEKPLPSEYVAFLRQANGGEGFLGLTYALLWPAEDLIAFNQDYEVDDLAPGFFLIGSDGGGDAYAFDLSREDGTIYRLPFIGMERRYAVRVAEHMNSFLQWGGL